MKIKGVNLGNWLVLEKWMNPALFEGTDAEDETWLARRLSSEEFAARLKEHRETYITEKDFEKIAGYGLNLVRIPVPYFIFGDRKPFVGCIEYLDRAFEWAGKHGLKVLIDLHTSPGNQNGYDNGGLVGVCKWRKNPEEVIYVLEVLKKLAKRYAYMEELFGIEVLNEPISLPVYLTAPSTGKAVDKQEAKGSGHVPLSFLRKFYKAAYRSLRKVLPADKAIVFHDGFRTSLWGNFFKRNNMENVYLDTHIYIQAMEMYVPLHNMACYKMYMEFEKTRMRMAKKGIRVIVGEWCINNRYAVHFEKEKGMSEKQYGIERRRRFNEVADLEFDAWEIADGWIYWSYKLYPDGQYSGDSAWKESWDLRRCIENRWIKIR